ncbi:MAG: carbon-nitrogen hydrolase family protein [Terracidiphilus sp.]|jgi:predicted amidohydrolase
MGFNGVTRRGFLTKAAAMGATALLSTEKLPADTKSSTATSLPCDEGDTFKVALLQMNSAVINPEATPTWKMILMDAGAVRERQGKNIEKADEFCRKAAALGADVALFPEMWNIGYVSFDPKQANAKEDWQALAVDSDSEYVRHFISLARELKMAIAVTYLQKWNPAPRNAVSIISRTGEIVLTYAKVHTCDFLPTEASVTPGDAFPVCVLDTRVGPVKVGCMTCYDREFPESARILMLNGAEVILVPNACGIDQLRIDQFKVRAYENAVGVAMTNYGSLPFDGNSMAFDAKGKSLVSLVSDGEERVLMAQFGLSEMREYRKKTFWGNAYRRPRKYTEMISENVDPVFARKEFFGQPFDRQSR